MKYLLDTNICIYLIRKKPASVLDRFKSLQPGDVGVSSITLSELAYGVEKSAFPDRNREALQIFTLPLEIADYGPDAAEHYGRIRSDLEKKGQIIGANDLLIAAHAMALRIPLVTNNTGEFLRVKGLEVQNWV